MEEVEADVSALPDSDIEDEEEIDVDGDDEEVDEVSLALLAGKLADKKDNTIKIRKILTKINSSLLTLIMLYLWTVKISTFHQ